MKSKLLEMVIDLIQIHQDIRYRLIGSPTEDFFVYDFDQTWSSTALGFGGCGGAAMTTVRTYVMIPKNDESRAYVYYGGRFAYGCCVNDALRKDIKDGNIGSVAQSGRYKEGTDDGT